MKLRFFFLFLPVAGLQVFAQNRPDVKFGKLRPADFQTRVYSVDSSASAVIIADIGSVQVVGNNKGWFSLENKHYQRAHILNKNGYDMADVSIYLYTDGDQEEKVSRLKAVTYNLENGKIVQTPLDQKASIFRDKLSKNLVVMKFTFPNVREGSIIEFEYTKTSDFLRNMDPWDFQGTYPRLWSEYSFELPSFFNYVFLHQGYRPFDIRDVKPNTQLFVVRDDLSTSSASNFSFTGNVSEYRWAMKNVPPLKQENYTSTLKNHISRIEFQLTEQREPLASYKYLETWEKLAEDLLKADFFGEQLDRENSWLDDYMGPVIAGIDAPGEKAKRIYAYIRDNFTCTNHSRRGMDQTLRNVARNRNGNVAEINLLLAAMLRRAGITADPVILSTRSHGYTYSSYPLPDRFNYVICRTSIEGKDYFLDASWPRLGFGKLIYECYNGHARVINKEASSLEFVSDSLIDQKITSVIIVNSDDGQDGSMQQSPGYYESYALRNRIRDNGRESFINNIQKSYTSTDVTLHEPVIDSLDNYEEPLAIRYNFNLESPKADIYYFNPMFGEGWKENPFKSAQRFYPVEMPYGIDETYLLRMDVPAGYTLDEMPKQLMVKLNPEGDGLFEYRLSESNGIISLRSRLRISRTFFHPDEYNMLRQFFNLVVKKHSEQIVFKRKQ